MKILEDILNREDTKNEIKEHKVNIKINKYGGFEDSKAYEMISILKARNINISKHIRMLLALEYDGKIKIYAEEGKNPLEELVASNNAIPEEKPLHAEPMSENAFD